MPDSTSFQKPVSPGFGIDVTGPDSVPPTPVRAPTDKAPTTAQPDLTSLTVFTSPGLLDNLHLGGTLLLTQLVHVPFSRPLSPEPSESGSVTAERAAPPESKLAKANEDRIALLARKYVVGALTPEERARLVISTIRVEEGIPSHTAEEFGELDRLEKRMLAIQEDLQRSTGALEAR